MSDMSDPSGHDRGAWKNPAAFAKQKATNIAEQQKSKVADRFAGAAGAVGDAAKNLQREMPQAAEYIEDVSDRLSSAAAALRERSIDNLIQTASTFARQQPAVFFAGAVFAGFALSRFLKSSNLEAQR